MVLNLEKGTEYPKSAEKRDYIRTLLKITVELSNALELDLTEVRDEITEEINRLAERKKQEDKWQELCRSLPYGTPMGF